MIVRQILTDILADMVTNTDSPLESWQYNTPSRANVENDYTQTPTAVMYCITDREINLTIAREVAEVTVGFLTQQANIDFDGLDNEALIEQMHDVALDFIARICNDSRLEINNDTVRVRTVFDLDDRNLTGVFCELTIREVQGQCVSNYSTES